MKYTAIFLGVTKEKNEVKEVECVMGQFTTDETEYPKNNREDIKALIEALLESKDFKDLQIVDVAEVLDENNEPLWNELTDEQIKEMEEEK